MELLQRRLGLNVVSILPETSVFDEGMYRTNPDMCCYLRKVEPLKKAFENVDVWISRIRRDQTENRASAKILDIHPPLDVIKVSPMANVTSEMQSRANSRLNLPLHPLKAKGYSSIGCIHCTAISEGLDERAGRWAGFVKTECGLHLNQPKPQSKGRYHMKVLIYGIDGGDLAVMQKFPMPFFKRFLDENESVDLTSDLINRGWAEILTGQGGHETGAFYMAPLLDGTHRCSTSFSMEKLRAEMTSSPCGICLKRMVFPI